MLTDHELRARLRRFWPGGVRWQAPMAALTTLKVGGPAQALVMPGTRDEVTRLINGCRIEEIPCHIIGGGSNLLVADEGLAGLVIGLGRNFAGIGRIGEDQCGRILVEVEAGCSLAGLLNWCADSALSGLEFAAGIPGTVGGAVVMNAGAWGREIKDVLASLIWLSGGEAVRKARPELDFTYRCLRRPDDAVILSAVFTLAPGDRAAIRKLCREHVAARRSRQPKAYGLAGSFFKNPEGVAAGKLIEAAGLKGIVSGGAMVSERHANFIVNTGNATAADIIRLMELVQARVWEVHRVRLEPEIKIAGGVTEKAAG
ncbi:MAG: UDP-N-acetylmuramate dehydrogenase [Desulfurivibrionaceae bacterium]|nr:UDP-N-acetylmuramate dehydrogenase [Desulfobulbales bacterium]MDT8334509.1 UDP-N-acetylmuramate dehydrogenase [Desulfurivibrionaceae bacterium]